MPNQKLTNEIIIAAIEGFEAQKFRIDSQIADLRGILDGDRSVPGAGSEPEKPRRKMSAAARKRIAAAQRKRWAESKKQAETPARQVIPEALKPKRKLSAAGKRNIIAATKKRWAAIKAEKAGKSRRAAPTRKEPAKKAAAQKSVTAPVEAAKE